MSSLLSLILTVPLTSSHTICVSHFWLAVPVESHLHFKNHSLVKKKLQCMLHLVHQLFKICESVGIQYAADIQIVQKSPQMLILHQ